MRIFPTAALLILTLASCSPERHADLTSEITVARARTPEDLLAGIQQSAKAKDWEAVKRHIYPVKLSGLGEGGMQEALLSYIKEADRNHAGDGSYSEEALALLIQQCRGKFVSSPEAHWLDDFRNDPALAKLPAEKFALLQLPGNVNVLAVDAGDGYKLLFWEGMNHLLEKKK